MSPGAAMPLAMALQRVNERAGCILTEIVVASSIDPATGIRVMASAEHHGLRRLRGLFTGGADISTYLEVLGVQLLLCRNSHDAQRSIDAGIAAATVTDLPAGYIRDDDPLRVAFDGDAVIFSEESERIYRDHGMEAFIAHEEAKAREPMRAGPFAQVLAAMARMQREAGRDAVRTALVTARNAPVHERMLRTLLAWGIEIDEALFLGGWDKGAALRAFRPHMFFDDGPLHIEAARNSVPCGLVPWRSANCPAEMTADEPHVIERRNK